MAKPLTVKVVITNVYQRVDRAVTFTATTALERSSEEFTGQDYPWRFQEAFLTLAEEEGVKPAEVEPDAAGAKSLRKNTPSQNLRWAIQECYQAKVPGASSFEVEAFYKGIIEDHTAMWRKRLGEITGANK